MNRQSRTTQLQTILESFPAAAAVLDEAGRITASNKRWYEQNPLLKGVSPDVCGIGSLFLTDCLDLCGLDPLPHRQTVQGVTQVIQGKAPEFVGEYRVFHPDEDAWFQIHAGAMELDGNRVLLCVLDVTERKWTEETLRESLKDQRDMFEYSPVGIFQSTPKGRLLNLNTTCAKILGFNSRSEALSSIGNIADDLYEDPRQRAEIIELLLREDRLVNYEVVFRRHDGSPVNVNLNVRTARDDSGGVKWFEAFIEDITRRKKADAELRESYRKREELETIVNLSPAVAFLWRNAAGRPVDFVSENIRQYGYQPADFNESGKVFSDLIWEDDKDAVAANIQRFLDEGRRQFSQEYRIVTGYGDIRWIDERSLARWGADGKISHIQGVISDITDRVLTEKALRYAKETAESANRAKSEFLANISHELRTPLNPILGMTELLQESEPDPEKQQLLSVINQSAHRLLARIDDLLMLNQIEAGRLKAAPGPFDPNALLDSVRYEMEPAAAAKGLALAFHNHLDSGEFVIADHRRLRQILLKLMDNAIKFTSSGGVDVSVIRENGQDDADMLHFRIADTGTGVMEEQVDLIFESFRQADGSMTRGHGGLGIGLSIARRLVHLLEGDIWLENRTPQGAIFHFTVKIQPVQDG